MTYNWCHNPGCHKIETQSRIRGSGDNKVLRTMKIKVGRYGTYQPNIWNYFFCLSIDPFSSWVGVCTSYNVFDGFSLLAKSHK